jgi:hypothetical protein
VLIVGQHARLNEAMCAVLEDAGYRVAVSSDTALALLRVSSRAVVVLFTNEEGEDHSQQ